MSAAPLLKVEGLRKTFKGLVAVDAVSFEVDEGSITAMIGPNGAGKTTTFNMIAGAMAPDSGEIALAGQSLAGLRADQVCHAGIGRTFQIVRPFPKLSVLDNVLIGGLRDGSSVATALRAARETLDLLGLGKSEDQPAGTLTLPERKRLEVARALACKPRLLLLDEVMAGLRPNETDELVATFRALNKDRGVTILLIEHVMRAVMALSDVVYVLNYGKMIAHGTPGEVVADPAVLECYLGEDTEI